MIKDQAEELRKLFVLNKGQQEKKKNNEPKNMRIITVASGKGGVGKTSVVSNLALSLTKLGNKVLIMDADLGMANIDIMFGLFPKHSLYDVIKGKKSLKEIAVTTAEGITIIPGGSGINELVNLESEQRDNILNELAEFSLEMDYLFIDCGAGVSKNILGFISAADDVLIVITPEPTSITDAYALIKILSQFNLHKEVSVIVNRVTSIKEADDTIARIENVADKFLNIDIKKIGFINQDDNVVKSIKEQRPFVLSYPRSKAAKDMNYIAENFLRGNDRPPQGTEKFIKKLINIFR
ncbi:flagellar biosynthesis protein FlhG [Desulfonispora thiosulfatigenes DSM 11270]|uniref:Flagellar biosynthesis protein FlhG n=1 Tax=Desulfonispora thiosulfatigenes DSM 11270 TaxID=656914 RepID=A0A1W1UND1_DESTI|nr:MinD/ParA family protein [Desulfonispora thiosulfatigenes]SMB82311.1 flagellar biosynthesis protein FlhG [Desulfonispora thiosulfatigenes DSM 11270]